VEENMDIVNRKNINRKNNSAWGEDENMDDFASMLEGLESANELMSYYKSMIDVELEEE